MLMLGLERQDPCLQWRMISDRLLLAANDDGLLHVKTMESPRAPQKSRDAFLVSHSLLRFEYTKKGMFSLYIHH